MEISPLLFLLLAMEGPDPTLPILGDEPYSDIERQLDNAQERLVAAQTFTCQRDKAAEALAPVQREYDLAVVNAKRLLGRDLNLQIWVNSCREKGDSLQFRSLLRATKRDLRKATRLIEAETPQHRIDASN